MLADCNNLVKTLHQSCEFEYKKRGKECVTFHVTGGTGMSSGRLRPNYEHSTSEEQPGTTSSGHGVHVQLQSTSYPFRNGVHRV